MSNTAILERPPMQASTSLKDRFISPAEAAHTRKIADNFRRLRFDSAEDYNSAREGEPVSDTIVTEAPQAEQPSAAVARISQYAPVEAPAGKRGLFEGVVYKDGKLEKPQPEAAPADATVATTIAAVPAPSADEEDAVPTRRTMDTLTRPALQQAEVGTAVAAETRYTLSTKMKAALVAVVTVILFAIVLICVNTSIIRSINADISSREAELGSLTQATQNIREQIADLTSPDSVAEWAARNNMVRG